MALGYNGTFLSSELVWVITGLTPRLGPTKDFKIVVEVSAFGPLCSGVLTVFAGVRINGPVVYTDIT